MKWDYPYIPKQGQTSNDACCEAIQYATTEKSQDHTGNEEDCCLQMVFKGRTILGDTIRYDGWAVRQ